MKKLAIAIVIACMLILSVPVFAQVYVNPYTRQDGTQVPGHYRSAPDHNPYNNYGTQGNVNPYTGQRGHENPQNQLNPYRQQNQGPLNKLQ
jgi:hypothetical protein